MSMIKKISAHKQALQTGLVLWLGFLAILLTTVYTNSFYSNRTHHQVGRRAFVDNVLRVYRLALMIPVDQLGRTPHLLDMPALSVEVAKTPPPGSRQVQALSQKDLQQYAEQHYNGLHLSLALQNGQWLVLEGGVSNYPWLLLNFLLIMLFLQVLLIVLCAWAVSELAIPMTEFAKASKRFGLDIHAPPLALQGSTEMQAVIHAFNEMQARIQRLIHDRTQMLAAISHDLRTPITRLQLRIEQMTHSHHADKALQDLSEMEKMIASILAFSQDYSRTEIREKFDLNALLEAITLDLQDAQLSVIYTALPHRIAYFGRVMALRRAISNLIENAVKYGHCAQVSLLEKPGILQIQIQDEGPGIPPQEMDKVFTPFYRLDSARTPDKAGVGLGMAVARDIIRGHGGEIILRNREGGGLRVQVDLPLE